MLLVSAEEGSPFNWGPQENRVAQEAPRRSAKAIQDLQPETNPPANFLAREFICSAHSKRVTVIAL